jgi:hypothetical protein
MIPNLAALTAEYRAMRDALLAEFPELADDGETLSDTLEGETNLPDVLADLIRSARRDEAMADGLGTIIKDNHERKSRLQARADKRRRMVLALMNAVEMGKLEQPDFTASVRRVPPGVVVTDEAALPDDYCRITRAPDKTKLRDALGRGEAIPGATLGNGSDTLTIRTR